jgi:hypothetical protein
MSERLIDLSKNVARPRGAQPAANPGWTIVGGRSLGTSHKAAGVPCQDSVAWWVAPPDFEGPVRAVAAVADGAGSATLAEVGSQIAVAEVVRVAQCPALLEGHYLDSEEDEPADARAKMARLFVAARKAVESAARDRSVSIRELDTTLAVALATNREFAVAQVGDGIVAVRSIVAGLTGLSLQRGEYANESTFLTVGDDVGEFSIAIYPADDIDAFGLSSDGLRLLITSNPVLGTPHEPFFTDVFTRVGSGLRSETLIQFLTEADDRTGDDKSLVVGVLAR